MYPFLSVWVFFLVLQTSYQQEIKTFLTVHKEGRTEVPVLVTVKYDEETIAAKPVIAPHTNEVTYSDYKKKFILRRLQMDGSPTCFLEHVQEMSFHADLDLLQKVKRSLIWNLPETLIISNASISNDDLRALDSAALDELCRDLQVYLLTPTTAKIQHNGRSKRSAHGRGRQPVKQRFHGQVEAQVSPAGDGSPGPEAFAIASPNAAVTKVGGTSGYAHAKSQVTVESDYGHGKSVRTMSSSSTFSSSRGASGGGSASQHQGGYGTAPQRGVSHGAAQYPARGQTRPASHTGYPRGVQVTSSAVSSVQSSASSGTASGILGHAEPSQYPASNEGRVPGGFPVQESSSTSEGAYKTYQLRVKHPNGYNVEHWYTGPVGSDGRAAIVEGPVETAPLQVNIPGGGGGRTVIATSASGGGDLRTIGVGISQSGSIAERAHAEAQSILSATETHESQGHHAAPVYYPGRQPTQQQQVRPVQPQPHAPSHHQQQHSQHAAFAGTYAQEPRPDQAPHAVHQQHYISPVPQGPSSQPFSPSPHGSVSPSSTTQQEVHPAYRPSYHAPSQSQQAHAQQSYTHHATSASSYTHGAHGIPSGHTVPQEQGYQQQLVRQPHASVPSPHQIPGSLAQPQQARPVQPQSDYVRQTVQQPVPHGGLLTQLQTSAPEVGQSPAMEAMAQHVFTQTERIPVHQPVYPVHIPQPQPSLQPDEVHQPSYHGGITSLQQGGVLQQSTSSDTHIAQTQHAQHVQQSHTHLQPSRVDHVYPGHPVGVHQSVGSGAVARPLPVPQPGQVVQDVRGQQIFQVVSGRIETVEDGTRVLQPGQTIPELPGSSVPHGFRGRVIPAGGDAGHPVYHQPSTTTQHLVEGQLNIHQQHVHTGSSQPHGYLPQQHLQQQPSQAQSGPRQIHPQYVQQRPQPQQEQHVTGQTVLQQQSYPHGPAVHQQGHSQHQYYQQQTQQQITEGQSAPQPIHPQQHVQPHPIPQPYQHQHHTQKQQPLGVQTVSQQSYHTQQTHAQQGVPAQHHVPPQQQQHIHSQQTHTQQQVYPQQVVQPQFTSHSETATQNEYVPTPQEMVDAMPSAQEGTTGRVPQQQAKPQQTQRPTGTAGRPNGNGRTPVQTSAPQQTPDTQDCVPAYYTCKIVYGPAKSSQICLPPPACCVPC